MGYKTILDLPHATPPLTGNERVELSTGESSTTQDIANLGGGGSGLVSYQNSAMSAPVMAYLWKDESDNIYRVYEPIRNNDVSRSQFAYADSIDLVPFDNTNWYDNSMNDVKLVGIGSDAVFKGCRLETMIIIGNGGGAHTGLQLLNHIHKGNFGQNISQGHDAEIYITGNDVIFTKCDCLTNSFFDSVGASSRFTDLTLLQQAAIFCNDKTTTLSYGSVGSQTYIWAGFDGGGIGDFYISSSCYVDLGSTFSQFVHMEDASTLGNASNDDAFRSFNYIIIETGATVKPSTTNSFDISRCNFGVKSTTILSGHASDSEIGVNSSVTSNGAVAGCSVGSNCTWSPTGDQSSVNIQSIAGSTYLLTVDGDTGAVLAAAP